MKKSRRTVTICLSALLVVVLILGGAWWWQWWWQSDQPPSEAYIRQQFAAHKGDYINLVTAFRNDPATRFVNENGEVDTGGIITPFVSKYFYLMHKAGAQCATIKEDGSVEFVLGGHSGAIESDSCTGLLYFPKGTHVGAQFWYTPTVVNSITTSSLPQENGAVASGLYIIPIEPSWYVYRYEYQE